jgi:8-amino-7-oxononanoate synthase
VSVDIAIIGLGCRFPSAANPLAFWEMVQSAQVTFRPVPRSRWNHEAFHDTSLRTPEKAYIARGAYLGDDELREFGALHFGIAPRRVAVTDPQHRLLLDAVRSALEDAGLDAPRSAAASAHLAAQSWDRSRAGVFIGASVAEHKELITAKLRAMALIDGQFGRKPSARTQAELEELTAALSQDALPMRAFSIAGNLLNMAAAVVAQQWNLGGPAFALDAACSSALVATHQAIVNLRAGQIDTAIAGGVYLNLLPDNLIGFSRIGAISRAGECRPFDASADGFVMGEGVGVSVLKRLDDALRDGDRVYAVIRGSGCNNDGKSEGPMTPRQGGQLDALRLAYKDAEVSPTTLGYIETHGTATTVGDVVEVGALRSLFEEQGWKPEMGAQTALGSVKANIGHTMSAAGAAGLIKATMALHTKTLPPQPSVSVENPKLGLSQAGGEAGPFYLPTAPQPWRSNGNPRRAAVSSFGFGGTNAHLVLEEAPAAAGKPVRIFVPASLSSQAWARPVIESLDGDHPDRLHRNHLESLRPRAELFLLSGARAGVVSLAAKQLCAALSQLEKDGVSLADIALTLATRASQDARLAIAADSFAQLAERLTAAAAALEAEAAKTDLKPQTLKNLLPGVIFAQGPFAPEHRKLALLFPGQGAQRVNLLRELDQRAPIFRARFDALDLALGPELHEELGGTLRSFLYPLLPPGADGAPEPEALQAAERKLTETQVCQPAMAALGLSLHALLESLGVKADALLGHSLGEFAAAATAGVITKEECVRLVAKRGLAMVNLPLADRGAMASIAADRALVQAVLSEMPAEHRANGAHPVVAANLNHPTQTVISGDSAGVSAARKLFEARGVKSTPLEVSHAFHSPLVAGVAEEMKALVAALALKPSQPGLISGITGSLYPSSSAALREIWVRHATAPVDFMQALQTAAAPAPEGTGARVFLQVGAGNTLSALARSTLPESERLAVTTLAARDEDGLAQFAQALGTLFCVGAPLDLAMLFAGRARLVSLPPSPIETQPYWSLEPQPSSGEPLPIALGPQASPTAASTGHVVPAVQSGLVHAEPGSMAAPQRSARMDSLVALFREQVALLQTQAQVLQRQAEALAGQGISLPELASVAGIAPGAPMIAVPIIATQAISVKPEAPAQPVSPAATAAATSEAQGISAQTDEATIRAEATRAVLASVARISAFPVEALKASQTLAGDLGFDSLMTVELDGDIQKSFPTVGALPRSLLGAGTSVQDVIDHVVRTLSAPADSVAPADALSGALGAVASAGPELLPFSPAAIESPRKNQASTDSREVADDAILPHALLLTRDAHGVAEALAARLAGAGHEVVLADLAVAQGELKTVAPRFFSSGGQGDALALLQAAAAKIGPLGGVIHLASIGSGASLAALVEAAKNGSLELSAALAPLLQAQRLARAQSKGQDAISRGLFAAITATGGKLGAGASDRAGSIAAAALSGFTKSLARERTDELVKLIDVDLADGPAAIADAIFAELRSGNADPEVGFAGGKRYELELRPTAPQEPITLGKSDVVLVSGGAKGVGLKLATDLAASAPGAGFLLAGRSAPGKDSEAAIAQLQAKGARAIYVQWDVSQPAPIALATARQKLGPITAILHAAGIAEDGPSANKDDAQLLRVISPKLAGLANLLAATAADPVTLALFTTSWSGRFGNAGQVDYAAGNAALGAAAALLPALRAGLRALALGLPPWEGTALVSKIPAFARAMLAEQGVPFIDDARGARALRTALQSGASGDLLLAPSRPPRRAAHQHELVLDRKNHVYLDDHQLAGQPVLPLASALDLLGAAALESAGGSVRSILVRDLKLRLPVRISEAARISVRATGEAKPGAELSLSLSATPLAGSRSFARAPSYAAFATPGADVSSALASAAPAPAAKASLAPHELPLSLDDFYATATFHGPRMRGITSVESISSQGIVGWVRTSTPGDLIRDTPHASWTVDPLALDGAFQLAGYWAWTQLGRAGFPIGIEEFAASGPLPEGPLRATLTLEQSQGDLVRGTIVLQGAGGKVVAVVRGIEGEFKHRDPRFLRARGLAAVKPVEAKPVAEDDAFEIDHDIPESPVAPPEAAQDTLTNNVTSSPVPATPAPNVAEELYKVELFPEVQELEQRIGLAAAFGLKNPYFNVHERVTNDTSLIGGRTMINWSSYNYVGLSGDPRVTKAAQNAIERYGTSVSASRIASGEKPLHRELEAELAQFLGTEDSVVMVSGHGVFVTVIGHLMGDGDLILHDSLAHDCIMGGAKLSGAKRRPFPHNDVAALERQLEQLRPHYKRVLIAVEGVYSMDGDICPLPEYIRLKKKYGCLLLVDEAHSIGVLGARGRGVGEHFGVERGDVDLWMGTMSKSLASCGGYVAGSKTLIQYLKYTTPGFVFSVGITPANAAAGLEALHQLEQHPEKVQRLHERARLFLQLAREKGIDTGMAGGSAVVPAIVGNSLHSLQLSEALRQRGINVQPILYPAVEETAARLRFFVTATHTEQQIRETIEVLAEELQRIRSESEQQLSSI